MKNDTNHTTIREVRVKDLILYFIIPLIVIIALWTVLIPISSHASSKLIVYIYVAFASLITLLILKPFAIGWILMYKAFAPQSIRKECRFVPTCSTYMIMAIQKYGLIAGVYKGIRRIMRCKPPNGGVDYP